MTVNKDTFIVKINVPNCCGRNLKFTFVSVLQKKYENHFILNYLYYFFL